MIWWALILQSITAFFIIWFPPILVARLGLFYEFFPDHLMGGIILLVASGLALLGILEKKNRLKFFFFLPQWALLIVTAGSALHFVFQGHYADGVVREWEFIFVDQLPIFVGALVYTFAVFNGKNYA